MSNLHSTAEKNARSTARGDYTRWLASRFGAIDMMSVKEGEDRVHLRNIYIPLRIAPEDQTDESMGEIDEVEEEELLGQDARDVIAQDTFVAISGRPGSGKTTMIQAIINDLCNKNSDAFRMQMVGQQGILPVPLILREYQEELHAINTLDDLLECWWLKAEEEAQDKKKYSDSMLDIVRLKQSYDGMGDQIPLLLLFDGIDELGGTEPRNKIVKLATQAEVKGHRVVLTGRPSGYEGLDFNQYREETALPPFETLSQRIVKKTEQKTDRNARFAALFPEKIRLYHAQPFAWLQIQQFIKKFYLLRDEWKIERERGIADINNALQTRDYLLTLARRPIFLTLMALVHVNDRRMPHGRADLYRRIIDLYLIRQTQQRRLKFTQQGEEMPHWEDQEVRRGLGYLAWLSQHRGSEAEDADEPDKRQVIWSRQEMLQALQKLLAGQVDPYHGRFHGIGPQQAEMLLDYYLHPAGLLIEPAEDQIQFTHLSFQEYLCAEYIHGRALAGGSRNFLDSIDKRLYQHLHLPGWDEVGMLLLTIHAEQGAQTEPTAHLELLAELDPSEAAQAKLLINALTGRELDYAENELQYWLPLAVATALVHPKNDFARQLSAVKTWSGPGLVLLKTLFKAEDIWKVLTTQLQLHPPQAFSSECRSQLSINEKMQQRWLKPENDSTWGAEFGSIEACAHSLLWLTTATGWVKPEVGREALNPVGDTELVGEINNWLFQQGDILYQYDHNKLPVATPSCLFLDRLIPDRGELWQTVSRQMPLDSYLLQGEFFVEGSFISGQFSQAPVLLSFYPQDALPMNICLALGLYQCLQVNENLAQGQVFGDFSWSRSLSRSQSWSWSWSLSQSWTRSQSLSQSRSLSRSLSRSRSRSLPRSLSRSLSRPQLQSWLWLLIKDEQLSVELRRVLKSAIQYIEQCGQQQQDLFTQALEQFGYRYAAHDWFNEQAENPGLMQRRGLRLGQPLPPELELFDETGLLQFSLPRQAIVNLAEWLQDDEQILEWFFPEKLTDEWRENLLQQLETLRGQPWSPQKAVEATLADWPEALSHRDTTLPGLERPLIEACEEILKNSL